MAAGKCPLRIQREKSKITLKAPRSKATPKEAVHRYGELPYRYDFMVYWLHTNSERMYALGGICYGSSEKGKSALQALTINTK